ncbi:cytochrome P450 [Thozetella sp. PMI_491]|nr:cytochrome P450 [Thozetella sp. PMI_491]
MEFIGTLEPGRVAVSLGVVTLLLTVRWLWPDASKPPALSDPIPYLSNTYQYMTNMKKFLTRAKNALHLQNIVSFHLGPMKVYLLTGAQNVPVMFRMSAAVSSDKFMLLIMQTLWGSTKEDLAKFANDKSGRLKAPAHGTEGIPDEARYWASFHNLFHNYLVRTEEANKLAARYQELFNERLEAFPLGEWTEVRLFQFVRRDMATASIVSLNGPLILEQTPDFLDILWDFDAVALSLAWGLPRFLNRSAFNKRERYRAACGRFLDAAWAAYDPNSPDAEADWEPCFGSRFMRELAKWMKACEFSPDTCCGLVSNVAITAQNSNTIPVTAWGVIELAKDPKLFQAVRAEVAAAFVLDPATQQRTLDVQKLISLPLMQSIYIELLRMHVSINITREVMEPTTVGDRYRVEKGSLLQAPSEIAHYDEAVWGTEEHPASEFWAERHLKYEEVQEGGRTVKVPKFDMAGRSNDFFPYGGGVSMCPGRFFAKQEILLTLALLVSRFDIEFVEWTTIEDGKGPERPAQNDVRWSGGAAVPPDRDMRVRWKRLW